MSWQDVADRHDARMFLASMLYGLHVLLNLARREMRSL